MEVVMVNYYFKDESFVIEDYNNAKTFSSFLPGIAGLMGVPMWLFYVNRGQCVASFGIQNKNGSMMEFFPANKSYQNTPINGFRTFIRINDEKEIYEPFSRKTKATETMRINQNEFEITSEDSEIGLKVSVLYYTVSKENYAGLIRDVIVENISDKKMKLEIIDGAPVILPYGIENDLYKGLGNTLKAWMDVDNLDNKIPFYKLRASTGDEAEVESIERGHFYLGVSEGQLLDSIIDADVVFGHDTTKAYPEEFEKYSLKELLTKEQVKVNKVPAGFFAVEKEIGPGEKIDISEIIGNVKDIEIINKRASEISTREYIEKKRGEANELVAVLTNNIACNTSSAMFDSYARQNYLDNVLRGGYPLLLETGKEPFVYHVYSRKHGDLERDYNFFSLEAGHYSQGNGNFRDANQNRRCDVLFNPDIKDFNVEMFMSLIQIDGYNPLVVKGCSFKTKNDDIQKVLENVSDKKDKDKVKGYFDKSYTPGELLDFIADKSIEMTIAPQEFLEKALSISEQSFEADYGEGYWVDHWTYNMDLVDTYTAVYPDKKKELLFENKHYMYYDSPVRVLPRSKKHVLAHGKPRQYNSVDHHFIEKEQLIGSRQINPTWMRTENGKGEIYKTNLFEKLLVLSLSKFACLDPHGLGVEMEANKPGWNDSMNGLPGMFGAGISETQELKRVLDFLIKEVPALECSETEIPVEVYNYLMDVNSLLDEYNSSDSDNKDYVYWDKVASRREAYREETNLGISGEQKSVNPSEIIEILKNFVNKINIGLEKALELGKGIYPTYVYYEGVEYEMLKDENGNQLCNEKGYPHVTVKKFDINVMPYFLEGAARALKGIRDIEKAKTLHQKVKESNVYDKKLKMYKVCESLLTESYDIGRARAFTPGWLENEAVFMHMEYKYLLSLLCADLYDEYYEAIMTTMVPFLDPKIYGRSILENSSFIASSANPDESLHGTGFVARLSGSTAEFVHMWNIMMAGKNPFVVKDGKLALELKPIIKEWLFDDDNQVNFRFLGRCHVTYKNPKRKNTYGSDKVEPVKYTLELENNDKVEIPGSFVPEGYAEKIRNGDVGRLIVELG